MSGASQSPWDSADFLADDETIIEYLEPHSLKATR